MAKVCISNIKPNKLGTVWFDSESENRKIIPNAFLKHTIKKIWTPTHHGYTYDYFFHYCRQSEQHKLHKEKKEAHVAIRKVKCCQVVQQFPAERAGAIICTELEFH